MHAPQCTVNTPLSCCPLAPDPVVVPCPYSCCRRPTHKKNTRHTAHLPFSHHNLLPSMNRKHGKAMPFKAVQVGQRGELYHCRFCAHRVLGIAPAIASQVKLLPACCNYSPPSAVPTRMRCLLQRELTLHYETAHTPVCTTGADRQHPRRRSSTARLLPSTPGTRGHI